MKLAAFAEKYLATPVPPTEATPGGGAGWGRRIVQPEVVAQGNCAIGPATLVELRR